jgi:ribose transport system substrate-binding protein
MIGLVACSSSGKSNSDATGSSAPVGASTAPVSAPASAGTGSTDPGLAKVQADLATFYQGTAATPPASGPKAQTGKSVWVISCGQQTSCAVGTAGAVQAGKALGWKTHICDGASDANNAFVVCMNQAIAAKANGIITVAIDCAPLKQPLTIAKQQHIPVVNMDGFDCDKNLPAPAGPSLFAASVIPSQAYPTLEDIAAAAATAQADALIAAANGQAKVINFDLTDITFGLIAEQATKAAFAACSGCVLYDVPFTLQQYTPQALTGLFQAAYLKHPDANGVDALSTSVFLAGVSAAIKATGKPLFAAAHGSESAAFDLVRNGGGLTSIVGQDTTASGWSAADTLNRLFAGQPAVPEVESLQLVDMTHNLPTSGGYVDPSDYQSAFKKVWSGG